MAAEAVRLGKKDDAGEPARVTKHSLSQEHILLQASIVGELQWRARMWQNRLPAMR